MEPRPGAVFMSLLFCGLFLFIFVFFPLARAIVGGFFDKAGQLDFKYFARYFDSYYGPVMRQIFWNTIVMGVLTSVLAPCWAFCLPLRWCAARSRASAGCI